MRASLAVLGSFLAASLAAQVDYRSAQSPVKHQGLRGTCAAHAIAAAMEVFPGMPNDLSEQFLYALQKKVDVEGIQTLEKFGIREKIVEGTYLLAYLRWFSIYGAPHERVMPYEGGKLVIKDPNAPADLKRLVELTHVTPDHVERMAEAWGKYAIAKATPLVGAPARDVDTIKRWLDEGALAVPAAYRIHGPTWSKRGQGKVAPEATEPGFTPEEMEEFEVPGLGWVSYKRAKVEAKIDGADFVTALEQGKIQRRDVDRAKGADERYGGHSMTIVGYTDSAFIVKNSWGAEWGNQGYCFVSFDYHRLYCWHCARIEAVKSRIPALSPFETTKRLRDSDYRLRVQPVRARGNETLVLSVLTMNSRDPMLEVVSYGVEARNAAGAWQLVTTRNVVRKGGLGSFDPEPGFATRFTGAELRSLAKDATALRFAVRFGHFPLGDRTKLEEAAFLATRVFGDVEPHPAAALELEPR